MDNHEIRARELALELALKHSDIATGVRYLHTGATWETKLIDRAEVFRCYLQGQPIPAPQKAKDDAA